MTTPRIAAILIVIAVALNTSISWAQEVLPLSQRQVQLASGTDRDVPIQGKWTCDDLYFGAPSETPDLAAYSAIRDCALTIKEVADKSVIEKPSSTLNRTLIGARVNYKKLNKWGSYDALQPQQREKIAAKKALEELNLSLREALRAHGLFSQFSATLTTGASFTATSATNKSPDDKQTPVALGAIMWESRHFGDESLNPIDISFGGRIGVQPVLTLVEPQTSQTQAPETASAVSPTATHDTAFVWTFGLGVHRQHRGINAESGAFVRSGSAQLTSVPSLVDRGGNSFIAIPVDNGTGKTAWFWDVGVEFSMFDAPLEQAHAEKGLTSPQFHFVLAWRNDQRFRREGSLADYRRPEQRMIVGLTIDALQVVDRRSFGQEAKTFTFGFSVEHERSLQGSGLRIPSGTRYMLRGDLNLLKGLTRSDAGTAAVPPSP